MLLSQDGNSRDRTGLSDHKMDDEMTSDEEDEKVDVGSAADLRPNLCFSGDQEGNEKYSRSKNETPLFISMQIIVQK